MFKTSKPEKERILADPKDINLQRPEDLWSDKGTPFQKKAIEEVQQVRRLLHLSSRAEEGDASCGGVPHYPETVGIGRGGCF